MIKWAATTAADWILASFFFLLASVPIVASAETSVLSPLHQETEDVVRDWFPKAIRVSVRAGRLPHLRVHAAEDGAETLIGFAYFTTDIEKLEIAYKAPINFLVGMTVDGEILGVKLVEHDEPYGYFSIETQDFQRQFNGKSILERFLIGGDLDAITSATITIESAARAIRNSGRRVARQFLAESRTDETR